MGKRKVLYDKDNIQLVKELDEETNKYVYSIITPETCISLTEELFNNLIESYNYQVEVI